MLYDPGVQMLGYLLLIWDMNKYSILHYVQYNGVKTRYIIIPNTDFSEILA